MHGTGWGWHAWCCAEAKKHDYKALLVRRSWNDGLDGTVEVLDERIGSGRGVRGVERVGRVERLIQHSRISSRFMDAASALMDWRAC